MKQNTFFNLLSATVVFSVLIFSTMLGSVLGINNKSTHNKKGKERVTFERSISRRSSPHFILSPDGDFFDYDYAFTDSAFQIQSQDAKKSLLELRCENQEILTYKATNPITITTVDNPDDPIDEQTSTTRIVPGEPSEEMLSAYVCENSLMRFESFSNYFNAGHYLYDLMKMFEKERTILLPVFDTLNSIRFHSDDRELKDDLLDVRELFFSEALDLNQTLADDKSSGDPPGTSSGSSRFKLWARWAEAIISQDIIADTPEGQVVNTVDNFAINRWLNFFVNYFMRVDGIHCNEVWGSFDSTNYYWNNVFNHEIFHHYFSSLLRDKSNNDNLPENYNYYKINKEDTNYTSEVKSGEMVPSVLNRLNTYFADIKRDFWDNNPLQKYSDKIDLSNAVGAVPITYEVDPARLSYLYEPEELLARLFMLMTFHWENLNPRILETVVSAGYDVCAPSFFLQDYMAFRNNDYSIDPFAQNNFAEALALILEAIEFNRPIARISKLAKQGAGISLQGWSKPNTYQKLVLEEINPLAATYATKRNIMDISWSASNFFVRESFNSPNKKYIKCGDDYDHAILVDKWTDSCQMWTSPLFDPDEIFDEFFTRTTEVNLNTSLDESQIYVGLHLYFWNDLNNDGLIQENEKSFPDITNQDIINARQMEQDPGEICKISIVKTNDRVELWRYVDQKYEDEIQNIDQLCAITWS